MIVTLDGVMATRFSLWPFFLIILVIPPFLNHINHWNPYNYLGIRLADFNFVTAAYIIENRGLIAMDAYTKGSTLCSVLPSGLKITHWNLNSFAPHQNNNKLDEIRLLLKNPGKETHILGITESWLNRNFKNSHVNIPGYKVERLDREQVQLPFNKQGSGGIAVYIYKDMPFHRRMDLEAKDMESVWIQLCPQKRPAHLLCFAYRSPDYDISSWLDKFELQITKAYLEGCDITIMGDFNIDLSVDNSHSKSWLDLTENFQLKQMINEHTRVTANSSSLIDHIFTSNPNKVRRVKVPKISLSDHFPICIVLKDRFGLKHCHRSINYRPFSTLDQQQFLDDLSQCPWDSVNDQEDVDQSLETWYNLLQSVVDKHLPLKSKRVKRIKQPEWMTDEIIDCMKKRDHHKAMHDFTKYKSERNRCVSLIREAKKIYYQSCITKSKGDSSKLWKYINELAPKDVKPAPTTLKEGNTVLTSTLDICESFNNYFATVVDEYLPTSTSLPDLKPLDDFINS